MFITGNLTKLQMIEMVRLQDTLNSRINPDWVEADNPYYTAIQVEAVEALDHFGWKWWKKQDPNMPQTRMEIVDIWHFILCIYIQNYSRSEAVLQLEVDLISANSTEYELNDLLLQVIGFANEQRAVPIVNLFNSLLSAAEMSWHTLYTQYLLKNTLNIFRQDNGYNTGSYHKLWCGKEDNWYLEGLEHLGTFDEVYTVLKRQYAKQLLTCSL